MRPIVLLLLLLLATLPCRSQAPTGVVMLSDLHFDPLRDPGKAARLAAASESEWAALLRAPATATQAADFAAIQAKCGRREGLDPDYSLTWLALHAASAQAHGARFVTVSGDLLVHQFECRWKLATGHSTGYTEFAEKTASFVIRQVEQAFPGVPVYVAMGNNDSSCGDYQMDLRDRFLAATAPAVLSGLLGVSAADRRAAQASYEEAGYYSVALPGLRRTRLLVLDDLFLSRKYQACDGSKHPETASTVLAWLRAQLASARRRGDAVWVLAHIPTGIDVYSTVSKMRNVCAGEAPELFLADDRLGTLLASYADTIRLVQFGHTHSDEVRLIGGVPAKIIGSVTPVNGNLPSFTVGQVDSSTSQLVDYTVYVATDARGTGPWTPEYRYRETFGTSSFTSASLRKEVDTFRKDPDSTSAASKAYEQSFYPGSASPLGLVWPQAVCALDSYTAAGYRDCVCKR